MVVDIEDLEKMDASGIDAKRLNAKEVIAPQSGQNKSYSQPRKSS